MLGAMEKYQIFFYTAGLRNYGKLVMQIIKTLVNEKGKNEVLVENTFSEERLIARDDNDRYLSSQDQFQKTSQMFAAGGDSTLKLKNVFKSLKALAGDNDRIFVIMDDRDDVWMNEKGELPINLLKVPPYFYHEQAGVTNRL